MNHITKKPTSLGKRKRWEQRAKNNVTITKPSTEGCTYKPLKIAFGAGATNKDSAGNNYVSNLSKTSTKPNIKAQTQSLVALIKKERTDSINAYNEALK